MLCCHCPRLLQTAKMLKADDGMLSSWPLYGLGRRSNVADRRQCDGQSVSMLAMLGSRKLGEISGTALLLLQMQMQLRRHAMRMKSTAVVLWNLVRARPGRARRRLGTRAGHSVCSWQSKHHKSPASGGAAEGLRSPLGLAVEDERLPWFLEAPSGED